MSWNDRVPVAPKAQREATKERKRALREAVAEIEVVRDQAQDKATAARNAKSTPALAGQVAQLIEDVERLARVVATLAREQGGEAR